MATGAEVVQQQRKSQADGKTIAAGEFKAKCLKLLDEVAETREPLIVTKHGKPVAKVVPIPERRSLFGALKGTVLWEGDIISPAADESEWDALR
jgi:prevent-host-death family protein